MLSSAGDLLALGDDNWRYELVEGRLVRLPPTSPEHSDSCGALYLALRAHVDQHHLGRVTMPGTGFLVSAPSQPDTVLAPDLACIRVGRLPAERRGTSSGFPRLTPDLAVEVASRSQHRPELAAQARLWQPERAA